MKLTRIEEEDKWLLELPSGETVKFRQAKSTNDRFFAGRMRVIGSVKPKICPFCGETVLYRVVSLESSGTTVVPLTVCPKCKAGSFGGEEYGVIGLSEETPQTWKTWRGPDETRYSRWRFGSYGGVPVFVGNQEAVKDLAFAIHAARAIVPRYLRDHYQNDHILISCFFAPWEVLEEETGWHPYYKEGLSVRSNQIHHWDTGVHKVGDETFYVLAWSKPVADYIQQRSPAAQARLQELVISNSSASTMEHTFFIAFPNVMRTLTAHEWDLGQETFTDVVEAVLQKARTQRFPFVPRLASSKEIKEKVATIMERIRKGAKNKHGK